MSGFATWGQAIQRVPAGETVFGTPINVLEAPFLHGVTIVEAPLLRPYTAIALTSSEVYIRNKRNPYWNLRGNRGDMVEGDWIAEMAIEVVNEISSRLGRGDHGVFGELVLLSVVRSPLLGAASAFAPGGKATSYAALRLCLSACARIPCKPNNGQRTTDHGPTNVEIQGLSVTTSTNRPEDWASPRSWPTAPGNNPEIYRLAVLLAQLSERYHKARKENGKPVFYMTELRADQRDARTVRARAAKAPHAGRGGRCDAVRGVGGIRVSAEAEQDLRSVLGSGHTHTSPR